MTRARLYSESLRAICALPVLLVGAIVLVAAVAGPARPAMAQDSVTPYLIMYDVTDLVKRVPDFPAPKLGLASDDDPDHSGGTIMFDFDDDTEDLRPVWGIDELVELIEKMIARDSWETAGIEIIGHRGWIIVTQTKNAHMDVAKLLQSLDRDYKVTSKLVELDDDTAAAIGYDLEGEAVQKIKRRQVVKGMKKLAKKGALNILNSKRVIMNETQSSSMVLASKSSESAVEVTETIETEVKRPKKGSGLELSWTVKGDEKEAKGKARVKHNEVVAVKTTTSEGKPALLLMRPKRVHD